MPEKMAFYISYKFEKIVLKEIVRIILFKLGLCNMVVNVLFRLFYYITRVYFFILNILKGV
jgi:hypothetical protein